MTPEEYKNFLETQMKNSDDLIEMNAYETALEKFKEAVFDRK